MVTCFNYSLPLQLSPFLSSSIRLFLAGFKQIAMSPLSDSFPRRFLSTLSELLITPINLLVFFLLDALDVVMCMFFRVLDEIFEGEPSSCYCYDIEGQRRREFDGENENKLSKSLFARRNIVRETNFGGIWRVRAEKRGFCAGKGNRWSDCGCVSCLSWMKNGIDSRLHLVVREPERGKLENDSVNTSVQNVIFIHGFLSSSSFWKETVFPYLSQHSKQNYRLFAVDLLGFGRSPKPRNCLYTIRDHLDMIEKSVILPYGVNSFHVVAHSMGCVIALALAAKYSTSVKSATLIAPPHFSSEEEDPSLEALRRLAKRRVWPPLIFGSAFMSWYEHLGRCMCFFICRNHRMWEWLLKLLTGQRELHFMVTDFTRHTHQSAWHTMHNVICGGAKVQDKYLETLVGAGVRIHVMQGAEDQVVPVECSYSLKKKGPEIDVEIIPNADHNTVILGREKELTSKLQEIWD